MSLKNQKADNPEDSTTNNQQIKQIQIVIFVDQSIDVDRMTAEHLEKPADIARKNPLWKQMLKK